MLPTPVFLSAKPCGSHAAYSRTFFTCKRYGNVVQKLITLTCNFRVIGRHDSKPMHPKANACCIATVATVAGNISRDSDLALDIVCFASFICYYPSSDLSILSQLG